MPQILTVHVLTFLQDLQKYIQHQDHDWVRIRSIYSKINFVSSQQHYTNYWGNNKMTPDKHLGAMPPHQRQ